MIGSTALRVRAVSAALALVAGLALLTSEPASRPASADVHAAAGSAVTLTWADGVTGADNQTVVEERDTSDPRYHEFEDLRLTIGQTENIRAQALDITWSGFNPSPTAPTIYTNALQIMQCWAESDSGPTPETCMWGPGGVVPGTNRQIDVNDPLAAEVADRLTIDQFPFRPANGGDPVLGDDLPFDQWTTNEVPAAKTDDLGGGELYFSALDGIDAPHLGCGVTGDDGEPRDCWLVIVPRGSLHLDGAPFLDQELQNAARTQHTFSPSHWANRMQVRLDFEAVDSSCPAGAEQRLTGGSQLVANAMYSWQPALCSGDGTVYGYTPTSDSEGRFQLLGNLPGSAGLAFTSSPVVTDDDELDVKHAPVAASGVAIAFNVEEMDRSIVRNLRLTPRLVAKLLTQSYLQDLPGHGNAGVADQSTSWWGEDVGVVAPPVNLLADPEYLELNDLDTAVAASAARLGGVKLRASSGSSDAVRELWRWVQADPEAAAWLAGEPDEWGMVINPFFEELNLEEDPPADAIPRDVDRCFLESEDFRAPGICSLDLLPYTNNFETSARDARAAATNAVEGWDRNATAPDGTQGWWAKAAPQPPGQRFVLAITDTASAAQYGLPTAELRNAAGEFVAPTDAGLAAGVEAMVPSEVDGVLAVDPEADDPAAYPLTMLTYAAIRGGDEQAARQDYADFLEYAAGAGQTRGFAAGQLPPGYLPLNEQLRAQALSVARELESEPGDPDDTDGPADDPTGLVPSGSDGGDESGDGPGDDEGTGGSESGDAGGGPGSDGADNGVPGGGDAPDPAALQPGDGGSSPSVTPPAVGAAAGGPSDAPVPGVDDADLVAQATPAEPIGPMQYALLAVLIVGLVGALGGPALLKLGPRHA